MNCQSSRENNRAMTSGLHGAISRLEPTSSVEVRSFLVGRALTPRYNNTNRITPRAVKPMTPIIAGCSFQKARAPGGTWQGLYRPVSGNRAQAQIVDQPRAQLGKTTGRLPTPEGQTGRLPAACKARFREIFGQNGK